MSAHRRICVLPGCRNSETEPWQIRESSGSQNVWLSLTRYLMGSTSCVTRPGAVGRALKPCRGRRRQTAGALHHRDTLQAPAQWNQRGQSPPDRRRAPETTCHASSSAWWTCNGAYSLAGPSAGQSCITRLAPRTARPGARLTRPYTRTAGPVTARRSGGKSQAAAVVPGAGYRITARGRLLLSTTIIRWPRQHSYLQDALSHSGETELADDRLGSPYHWMAFTSVGA